jgi:glutamate-1-semialdehyde 2,1-aminomutase
MAKQYIVKTSKSETLHERATRVLPAGVSYSIRFFEPYPFYTAKAEGGKIQDVDSNVYVDYWLGHTALILGHSPPEVVKAVGEQLDKGTHYGTSHELEIQLAEQVAKMVPSAEMTRFTNSGTEANMYATRLARAYTSKRKIAKFEGGWHGGYDALHIGVKPPFDVPESAGLTECAVHDTILLPFNDLEGVEKKLIGEDVASIVIEPVLGAGGGVPVDRQFLKGLREYCTARGILLIFDEVITGFRLAPGGAQQYYNVIPDMTVLGKILGGGFPVGAFCASKEIMSRLDHTVNKRPEYSFHGGTFAANPITMTAGLTTLKLLQSGILIRNLNNVGDSVRKQLKSTFTENKVTVQVTGESSIFSVHFTKQAVRNANDACAADRDRLVDYGLSLIANGVFILPGHNAALCTKHTQADIKKLISATQEYARTIPNK